MLVFFYRNVVSSGIKSHLELNSINKNATNDTLIFAHIVSDSIKKINWIFLKRKINILKHVFEIYFNTNYNLIRSIDMVSGIPKGHYSSQMFVFKIKSIH